MKEKDVPYNPPNQIITIFPTNKTGFSIQDALSLDDPKIHFSLFPTKEGSGERVDFWVNVHAARVLFTGGQTGKLPDLIARHNKKSDPNVGFDLYAKMQNGYRTLTIRAGESGGVWVTIVNKNGSDCRQSVFLPPFTWASVSMAVLEYLRDYGAVKLARVYIPQETAESALETQESAQAAGFEPSIRPELATRPEYELVKTPSGNLIGDLSNEQIDALIKSSLETVTKYMRESASLVRQNRLSKGEW